MLSLSCAPVDDPPAPNEAQEAASDRLVELLLAIARHDAPAGDELSETLERLGVFPPAGEATARLAGALTDGLPGARIDRDGAQRIASYLFMAMNGGYLDRARLSRLVSEVEATLDAAGVPPPARQSIGAACVLVARQEANPRKDWW